MKYQQGIDIGVIIMSCRLVSLTVAVAARKKKQMSCLSSVDRFVLCREPGLFSVQVRSAGPACASRVLSPRQGWASKPLATRIPTDEARAPAGISVERGRGARMPHGKTRNKNRVDNNRQCLNFRSWRAPGKHNKKQILD